MNAYQTRVYDLDGTLVRLNVDWEQTTADVRSALATRDIETAEKTLWELLAEANAAGHGDVVEQIISAHERAGAQIATRLPIADELPAPVPVGVCSLNCEAACQIALEQANIAEDIDVVVGRDTVSEQKPDPEPLLWTIEQLGGDPETTIFIGDSQRDRAAADRAGVDFRLVDDRTDHR